MQKEEEQVPVKAEELKDVELQAKIDKLEEEKKNIVGELQEDRKKRQEMKDEIDSLKELVTNTVQKNVETKVPENKSDEEKIAETVKAVLRQETAEKANKTKEEALSSFLKENKEFNEENDPSGLKRDAFAKKLARFNTSDILNVEDYKSVLKDAKELLFGKTETKETINNPFSSTQMSPSDPAAIETKGELSPKEQKLIDGNGWTKERYLGLKTKMPEFVESLLNSIK